MKPYLIALALLLIWFAAVVGVSFGVGYLVDVVGIIPRWAEAVVVVGGFLSVTVPLGYLLTLEP